MITKDNYFSQIKNTSLDGLPEELKQAHHILSEKTEEGKDWSIYDADPDIKNLADLTFSKLGEFLGSEATSLKGEPLGVTDKKASLTLPLEVAKDLIRPYILRGDSVESLSKSMMGAANGKYSAHIKSSKIFVTQLNGKKVNEVFGLQKIADEIKNEKGMVEKPKTEKINDKASEKHLKEIIAKETERISEEVRFIRRFAALNGKAKEKREVLSFLNSLQRAILEKRIRKSSRYVAEIRYIQEYLLKVYNNMDKVVRFKLMDKIYETYRKVGRSEKVRPSVQFIKRYIGLQGKADKKIPAKRLAKALENALDKKKISSEDPYKEELDAIWKALKSFERKGEKSLPVQKEDLKGLFGAAKDNTLGELEKKEESKPKLMSSMDFANMEFFSIGFTGKWLELIGDPCKGFTAMVYGKPKMGKSYLCIDFASYLATHFGKVLYVAREERLDATLQKKLSDRQAYNPNLFVSDSLPGDLSEYDFIFLDSVNKLALTPKDIEDLREKNPGKSFICIFQTTKDGHFKGKNEFQHDVDVVIEIPQRGKAVQFGRFNQGGEMDIFPKEETVEEDPEEENMEDSEDDDLHGSDDSVMLAGINKKDMKNNEELPDELNPEYIFSLTSNQLLVDAVNKKIDLDYYARKQLANRGLDKKGKWVGFEKAKQLHRI